MTAGPPGRRIVRWLARLAARVYPRAFRDTHLGDFGDVATHLWDRERAASSPARATLSTVRILAADTIKGSTEMWMTRVARFVGDGGRDVRLAVRAVGRRPGFGLLVVLTLGLGIGASATAFDALDRTLLRPLPFHESDRLTYLALREQDRGTWSSPWADTLERWRQSAKTLEQIEVYAPSSVVLHGASGAERLDSLAVSGGLLSMLRVVPVAGRLIQPADAEPGAPPVVMIAEHTWRARFGADPDLVGRTLPIGSDPQPTTVVGVLPAGAKIDTTLVPQFVQVRSRAREYPRGQPVSLLARMKPGVTSEAVETELRAITPADEPGVGKAAPSALTPGELYLGEAFSRGVWLVFAGAIALLAVAIVNAGHLLLGRAAARSHELGVRLALGGSGLRLARLFLAEAFVYIVASVALGAGIMVALERLIQSYEPRLFMTMDGAGLEGRAIWFIVAIAGVAMLACAAVPLLRSRAQDLRAVIDAGDAVRSTSRGSRAMRALVVTQTAIAVLLLCGAGVMVRSFSNLLKVDSGMALDQLVEVGAAAPSPRYSTSEARGAYLDQVGAALRTIPTVVGVTTSTLPLLNSSPLSSLPWLDGEAKPPETADSTAGLATVPVNYFDVTGIRLIEGRLFQPEDSPDVAVVNGAFAASRGGNVIGRSLYTTARPQPWRIVGVVADVKNWGLAEARTRHQIYFLQQRLNTSVFNRFVLRTTGDPSVVLGEARQRVAAIDRTVPVFTPQTGEEVIRRQTSQHRFAAVLLSGLAALGFGLALSGVYGLIALNVSQRRREIGIRLALGATRRGVARTIVRSGVHLVAIGGLFGVIGAWLALPYVEVLLFNVGPRDPWSVILSLALAAGAAAVASWIPARRASRIDPALTLRQS
jgi:putative ABC transport system permease protein